MNVSRIFAINVKAAHTNTRRNISSSKKGGNRNLFVCWIIMQPMLVKKKTSAIKLSTRGSCDLETHWRIKPKPFVSSRDPFFKVMDPRANLRHVGIRFFLLSKNCSLVSVRILGLCLTVVFYTTIVIVRI